MPSKREKKITPLSESMKKGAEPLRSFSDLAQFLGRIQPVDPAEEKRRKKEEKLAKKREAEVEKGNESDVVGTVVGLQVSEVNEPPVSEVPVSDAPLPEDSISELTKES